ncbi:lipocalin family protein [Maribacter sp. 2-571]|uniref:lipocalin family protein n=1 Tax=Maribacter sp. 2-571 TaxID=3417569 RepID=UPI003D3256A0
MKRIAYMFGMLSLLAVSCSDDDGNDGEETPQEASLVGTWDFVALDATGVDEQQILLAEDVIEVLIQQNCDILTFTFADDQTVTADYRDFTETGRDVNPDGSGLLIECPEEVISSTSVWSLEGDQLTFVNGDLTEETVTIELTATQMIVPAEIVDEDNLAGAKAIFERQ